MVQSGLLLRCDDAQDRRMRITRIRLSAKGLKMAGRMVAQARTHEAAVVAALGETGAGTLKRLLRALIGQPAGNSP